MLQSALVRFTIRLAVLVISFALSLGAFALGSAERFTEDNLPPAMPVAIAAGPGAAVLRYGQLQDVPVDVALATQASGCPDAVHCLAVEAPVARIREQRAVGFVWWTQQLDGNQVTSASVWRVDALMAFPALLIAVALSQGVAWWLRRLARNASTAQSPAPRRRST